MAKPTNAIVNRNNHNDEQFKIAVSHDIKEVIIKIIDLIMALATPAPTDTK